MMFVVRRLAELTSGSAQPPDREESIVELRQLVTALAAGRGGTAWIEGGAGSGKSTLLEWTLSAAVDNGCQVFWATAREYDGPRPWAPERVWMATDPSAGPLLRATAADPEGAGLDTMTVGADEVAALAERLCRAAPTLVAVDDLHWADASGLAVLRQACRLSETLPLLLVVAARPTGPQHPLSDLRRDLAKGLFVSVDLAPLPHQVVDSIVAGMLGALPGPRLRRAVERAVGNPGRVREIVTELAAHAGLSYGDGQVDLVGPGDPDNSAELATVRLAAAEYELVTGDWDPALAKLGELTAELRHDPDRWSLAHGAAALIAVHRDRPESYEEHAQAVRAAPVAPSHYLRIAEAVAADRAGDPDLAHQLLLSTCGPDAVGRGSFDYLWLPELVRLASLRAANDTLFGWAAATGAHVGSARQAVLGHCQGWVNRDPDRILAAARDYEAGRLPLFAAQALENAAVLLAEDGQAAAARAAHAQATVGYLRLGAAWDLRRADTRLRTAGVRSGRRGPRQPSGTGWALLTPTEVKVALLVSEGLTNPEMARRLSVSPRTVQTHVAHIMDKLGVRTRAAIARIASARA